MQKNCPIQAPGSRRRPGAWAWGVGWAVAGWPQAAQAANLEDVSRVAVVGGIALVFALGMMLLAVQLNVLTSAKHHRRHRGSHLNFFQRYRKSVIVGGWLAIWLAVLAALFFAAHR